MTGAAATAAPGMGARLARDPALVVTLAALWLLLGLFVVYPLAMLVLGALTTTNPALEGLSSTLTLQNFQETLGNEQVRTAAVNSLISCGLGTFFAVIIGVGLSWIVARTDTPMRGWVETASIMPLFMPPLVAAVAWSYVGSPTTGLINMFFKELDWEFRLNMYSMTGMVAVFVRPSVLT